MTRRWYHAIPLLGPLRGKGHSEPSNAGGSRGPDGARFVGLGDQRSGVQEDNRASYDPPPERATKSQAHPRVEKP